MTIEYPAGSGVHKFSQQELYELMCMYIDNNQPLEKVLPARGEEVKHLGRLALVDSHEITEEY